MEKYDVNENDVLEILSEVTAAKREASMVSQYIYIKKKRENVAHTNTFI
jgi:hypothetical protein